MDLVNFLKKNGKQIVRFLMTGFFSTTLNFICYYIVYNLTLEISLSSLLGYSAGLLNSYLFSKKWVFKSDLKFNIKKEIVFFLTIYFLGGLLMNLVTNIVFYFIRDYKLAWFIGTSIAALNNYLGCKYFVFRN